MDAETICSFITADQNELNISDPTRDWKIKVSVWLSSRPWPQAFEHMTKQDILEYLGNLRKIDADDPTHKWISMYNNRQMLLNKFFRWLYNQDEQDNPQGYPVVHERGKAVAGQRAVSIQAIRHIGERGACEVLEKLN